MAYATVQQLVDVLGETEARALAPAAGAGYDAARISAALESASGTLDTYFAVKFPTPVSPVPTPVRDAAIVLARESLDRAGRDVVIKAADRVRAWARDVAKGLAVIGGGTPGEDTPTASTDSGILFSAPDRVFDDAGLAPFLGTF
jgi:phage gp36-like protein